MENKSKTQQNVENPRTTVVFDRAADIASFSRLGIKPRIPSLLEPFVHAPYPPLPLSSGHPGTDLRGPVLATPPGAPLPPALPQDLLDLDVEVPDKEGAMRQLVLWMGHINVGCDCPEEVGEDEESPGHRKLLWCRAMENLMEHATQCTAGSYCLVGNCALTNAIFRHCETCTTSGCFVCVPAKPFRSKTTGRSAGNSSNNTRYPARDRQQQNILRDQFESRRVATMHRITSTGLVSGGGVPNPNQAGAKPDQSILPPAAAWTAHSMLAASAAVDLQVPSQAPPQRMMSVPNAYQQLVEALNRPPGPEQQQRVCSVLRGSPEMIQAFLRLARTDSDQQAPQHHVFRPAIPQRSQSMPGQPINGMLYQGQPAGQFQHGHGSAQQRRGSSYNSSHTALSATHFDLETHGEAGTKAPTENVVIPISSTTKLTYDWKTWIPRLFRFRQRFPWQCKVAGCMAVVLITGMAFFFFGFFVGLAVD